jgi:hypothetical protein
MQIEVMKYKLQIKRKIMKIKKQKNKNYNFKYSFDKVIIGGEINLQHLIVIVANLVPYLSSLTWYLPANVFQNLPSLTIFLLVGGSSTFIQ